MAETVANLLDAVKSEASFDVSDPVALRWLSRRHRVMVRRSRCYRFTATLGPTVAGQRDYPLPSGLVEIQEVTVGGTTYGRGRHTDLARGAGGFLLLDGEGGIVASEESATGALELALYPTPSSSGSAIMVRAAWLPPDLATADDSTLKIPEDFTDALIAGAVATGLRRVEHRPDLAQPHEQEFADACEELRRLVSRRYRGPGAAQIRVVGINA